MTWALLVDTLCYGHYGQGSGARLRWKHKLCTLGVPMVRKAQQAADSGLLKVGWSAWIKPCHFWVM